MRILGAGRCRDFAKAGRIRVARLFGLLRSLACVVAVVFLVVAAAGGCGDSHLKRAHEAERKGDYEAAIALYQSRLENDPNDIEALRGIAPLLFVRGEFDKALVYQERLVYLDPKDVQTRVELGFNYLNHQGRPVDAARVLGEAASLQPSARNLTFWAQALIVCDETSRAEEVLRKAIATDASYGHAYQVLYQLLISQGKSEEASQLREDASEHGVLL